MMIYTASSVKYSRYVHKKIKYLNILPSFESLQDASFLRNMTFYKNIPYTKIVTLAIKNIPDTKTDTLETLVT